MLQAMFMGDNLVLLTPKNGEQMEDIIKLNNEWFNSVFEDVQPGLKIMWLAIKLYGLDAMVYSYNQLHRHLY